jgi:serine/threonine protein kinase/tetratricopeptide (TPR) repeat protein
MGTVRVLERKMSVLSSERWQTISPYLDRALEMGRSEREDWVDTLRADHPALAAELEALLQRRDALSLEGFLATLPHLSGGASAPGEAIGPYTLVSRIGQGGTGTVWLARRSDGRFDGLAAIKLLNPELVGQVSHARFEREAGILARLSHPHVAHLIDAGVCPAGQPYLVLERVDGDSIDRHCDDRRMEIRARVRLFLDVLGAVAHAHGQLIVHTDIKPSNVLVTDDGRVKLLDFGIAKLLDGEQGGAAAALTREGGRAMTPAYAAPEQVAGEPITTATDVYALGVLLYQLLSGLHPAGDAMRSPAELFKAIVEVEPPRLSSAVRDPEEHSGRLSATLAENAACRSTTPDRLRRILRGDLDTIVAKALKKSPHERYRSVTALADDLRRYLDHEPIRARPDAMAYRAAKFVRRNRVPTALAALTGIALLIGMAATISQARRAAAQAARADSMRAFMFEAFAQAEPGAPRAGPASVVDAVERAIAAASTDEIGDPRARAELLIQLAQVLNAQGGIERARGLLVSAVAQASAELGADDPLALEADSALLWNDVLRGDLSGARARADRLLARIPEDATRLRVEVLRHSANLATKELDRTRALDEARRAVDLGRRSRDETMLTGALSDLGNVYLTLNAHGDAIRTYEELLVMARRRHGAEHVKVAAFEAAISRAYRRSGALDRAEAHARAAIAIDRKVYKDDHWRAALHLNALAVVLYARRAYPEALAAELESLRIKRATLGDEHPDTLDSLHNIGMGHLHMGEFAEAVPPLRASLAGSIARYGAEHEATAITRACLGHALAASGRRAEGEAEIDHALATAEALTEPDPNLMAECLEKRIRVALDAHDPAAALPFLQRMRAAVATLPGTDPYWTGRVDALQGDALLALGRTGDAVAALDAAAGDLAASPAPDVVLSVEVPLLRAAAAHALGDRDRARSLARDARVRLDALPNPPGRLVQLATRIGP